MHVGLHVPSSPCPSASQSESAIAVFSQSVDFLLSVNLSPEVTSWAVLNLFSGTPQSELDAVLRITIPTIPGTPNTPVAIPQSPTGNRSMLASAPPPHASLLATLPLVTLSPAPSPSAAPSPPPSAPFFVNWTATGRTTPVHCSNYLTVVGMQLGACII